VPLRDDLISAVRYAFMMRRSGKPLDGCEPYGRAPGVDVVDIDDPRPRPSLRSNSPIAAGTDFDVSTGQQFPGALQVGSKLLPTSLPHAINLGRLTNGNAPEPCELINLCERNYSGPTPSPPRQRRYAGGASMPLLGRSRRLRGYRGRPFAWANKIDVSPSPDTNY